MRQTETDQIEQNSKYLPSKAALMLRIVAGGYLLYTAYSLRGAISSHEGGELIFFVGFTVFFIIAGIFLLLNGILGLKDGKYLGAVQRTGEKDRDEDGPEL